MAVQASSMQSIGGCEGRHTGPTAPGRARAVGGALTGAAASSEGEANHVGCALLHSLMAADQVIRFDGPSCQSTAMPALQSDDDVCAGGGAGRVASRAVLLPVPTMRPRRDPRAGKPARKQTRIISALWPLRSRVRFDSRGLARPTRHHSPGGIPGRAARGSASSSPRDFSRRLS